MKITKNIAVILSGCGYLDGAEIHEATLTLLAIHKAGADFICFAPDIDQHHVINHLSGSETGETRNVLIESARIARGNIKDIREFKTEEFDALILPGGFGAAKNLSNYAFAGADSSINKDVAEAILAMHKAGKPIGALCIAPVILAKLVPGVSLTIGQDVQTATDITAMGAQHQLTLHGEIVIDEKNKIVTTPCYMLESRIDQIAEGAEKVVQTVMKMS